MQDDLCRSYSTHLFLYWLIKILIHWIFSIFHNRIYLKLFVLLRSVHWWRKLVFIICMYVCTIWMSSFSVIKRFKLRIKSLKVVFIKIQKKKKCYFGSNIYYILAFIKKIILIILITKSFKLSYPHIFPICYHWSIILRMNSNILLTHNTKSVCLKFNFDTSLFPAKTMLNSLQL